MKVVGDYTNAHRSAKKWKKAYRKFDHYQEVNEEYLLEKPVTIRVRTKWWHYLVLFDFALTKVDAEKYYYEKMHKYKEKIEKQFKET